MNSFMIFTITVFFLHSKQSSRFSGSNKRLQHSTVQSPDPDFQCVTLAAKFLQPPRHAPARERSGAARERSGASRRQERGYITPAHVWLSLAIPDCQCNLDNLNGFDESPIEERRGWNHQDTRAKHTA